MSQTKSFTAASAWSISLVSTLTPTVVRYLSEYTFLTKRDTKLVFYCHTGVRSAQAAEHFRRQGFSDVYNVVGGIDAWSKRVDSSVPVY